MPPRRESNHNVKRPHHRIVHKTHLLKVAGGTVPASLSPTLKSVLHRRPTPSARATPDTPPQQPASITPVVEQPVVEQPVDEKLELFNLLSMWHVSLDVKRAEIKPANVHFDITKRAEEFARNIKWFTSDNPEQHEAIVAL